MPFIGDRSLAEGSANPGRGGRLHQDFEVGDFMLKSEDFGATLNDAAKHLQAGGSLEALLFEIRRRGADKIDSIKVIKSAMALSMPQAKSLVDRSETWSDR